MQDRFPFWPDDERGNDVPEQDQREPFQNGRDLMVTGFDRGDSDGDCENENEIMGVKASEHLGGVSHPLGSALTLVVLAKNQRPPISCRRMNADNLSAIGQRFCERCG